MRSMLSEIEDRFASAARTPKGARALRAIFHATREIVSRQGLDSASLDLISDRAGLTQAALRHYFRTRDALIGVYFATATDCFRARIAQLLDHPDVPARERLERCIGWHLEYMESVDTMLWLEASAYWLRQRGARNARDEWYRWLTAEYATLIRQIHPSASKREHERRAYAIVTLVLGAWMTHGKGSSIGRASDLVAQRQLLVDTAMDIALQ
jgi:AcrR family transcriptional regulator